MKKVSLLMLVAMFLFAGNLRAQEVEVLIEDDFSAYTVGNKLASEANAAGNDWWTTWSSNPGGSEDGVIAEYEGNKCARLTSGNDQVLLLGGSQSGVYDLEFDILVPEGKSGYFNILHKFAGSNSSWAMQAYLHITSDGNNQSLAPGHGTVHAGSNSTADVACVYDEWMHFRLHVDTDADQAQYYYTVEGGEEVLVCTWQWSLDSFGESVAGRELDAMNFYPPMSSSEYYLDNFKCTRIGGETAAELVFNPEAINETVPADDIATVEISIDNEGTSIGDYSAWVDYGVGGSATGNEQVITYAVDPVVDPSGLSWTSEEPVQFEVASLFPATSYANSVMGTYITHAAYAFFEWKDQSGALVPTLESGTDVIFRIYGQGHDGAPGDVLAEKVIAQSQIVWDEYTMVQFDEPVALTGFDVYVAVEMTAAVQGTTMSLDGTGQAVQGFGDLYRQNKGAFQSITENAGQNYGNWCLFMLCQGTPVTGGFASIDKTYGSIAIGASDEIEVTLSTVGLTPGQTYEAAVKFVTTDPEQPEVEIPLTLTVGGESISENLSEVYAIYPNPTSGLVTVEAENINYIAVYNSVGQLVNVVKNENNTVDMSQYENGVYYFNIVDNAGQSAVQRIVVAK